MEKFSQRDRCNVARLAGALEAHGEMYVIGFAYYLQYATKDQLLEDIESLSRVIDAFLADQREDGDE